MVRTLGVLSVLVAVGALSIGAYGQAADGTLHLDDSSQIRAGQAGTADREEGAGAQLDRPGQASQQPGQSGQGEFDFQHSQGLDQQFGQQGQQQQGQQAGQMSRPGQIRGTGAAAEHHGVNQDLVDKGRIVLQAKVAPKSPAALLGQANRLNLTQEQRQRLQQIEQQASQQALAVLNDEQKEQLGDALEAQPISAAEIHQQAMQQHQQWQQRQGAGATGAQPGMTGTGVQPGTARPGMTGTGVSPQGQAFDPVMVILGDEYRATGTGTSVQPRPGQPGLDDVDRTVPDVTLPGRSDSGVNMQDRTRPGANVNIDDRGVNVQVPGRTPDSGSQTPGASGTGTQGESPNSSGGYQQRDTASPGAMD